MADNLTLNAGSGGSDLWTDEVAGPKHAQIVKLADGTADAVTLIAAGGGAEANALRVTLASDSTGVVSVDGTVTANLSATDNAVLDAIAASLVDVETNTDSGAVTGGGVEASALRVTIANDSTGVVTVDGTVTANLGATDNAVLDSIDTAVNGTLTVGSHAVTNAGTFVVQEDGAALTALQLMDDPIFADDAAFTLGSSKVTVAGAVRDDSLSTLTAIEGDAVPLRVSSTGALHVTGGGGGTEYNEDVATPATITGTATMVERDDALTTVTPAEGDWISLRGTAEGALWVQDFNSDTIAGAVKAAQGAQGATDTGIAAMAVRNDTLADKAGADGDYAPLQVDANGALYVHDQNLISINNSTTSTLTASSVFTGTGDDVSQYSDVTIQIDASHDSATDGMTFQFSTDNSNWDDIYSFTYAAADGARRFQFPVTAQYFRFVYTNGGAGQTHFRVQTILHSQNTLTSIHRMSDNIDPDRSAQLVKAAVVAQAAGSGDFITVDATAGGNLKVSISEASDGLDIGAGNAGSETIRVSVASDDVNLSAIKTAVEILDNIVSGSEAQVDIVSGPQATSHYRNIDANAEDEIKGSAGTLFWLHAINRTAAIAYVHLYDATAASVTPGTTTPDFTFPVPTQGDTNGAGFNLPFNASGHAFANGITLVCTTTLDGSTGDPGTNGVIVNLGYG